MKREGFALECAWWRTKCTPDLPSRPKKKKKPQRGECCSIAQISRTVIGTITIFSLFFSFLREVLGAVQKSTMVPYFVNMRMVVSVGCCEKRTKKEIIATWIGDACISPLNRNPSFHSRFTFAKLTVKVVKGKKKNGKGEIYTHMDVLTTPQYFHWPILVLSDTMVSERVSMWEREFKVNFFCALAHFLILALSSLPSSYSSCTVCSLQTRHCCVQCPFLAVGWPSALKSKKRIGCGERVFCFVFLRNKY